MIQLLKRFFDDVHEIRLYLTLRPESKERFIELCQADRDLLSNFRRRKPKKEMVNE